MSDRPAWWQMERRKDIVFLVIAALVVIAAVFTQRPASGDPLPPGNYIDLREGGCRLTIVRDDGVRHLEGSHCSPGPPGRTVSMRIDGCGNGPVQFTPKDSITGKYFWDGGITGPCPLNGAEKPPFEYWTVLR